MAQNPSELKEKMTPAVLAEIHPLAGEADLAVFHLRPEAGGEVPSFEAGQYTTVGIENDGEFALRYYSIASAPEQRDHLEFYVARLGPEPRKPELFHLEAGTRVWYGDPGGGFTLSRTEHEHLVFVAGGTGLAPFISMLRHLKARTGQGGPAPAAVSLWHGVRHTKDLAYASELRKMEQDAGFPFRYLPIVSRSAEDRDFDASHCWQGRVNEVLAETLGLTSGGDARPCVWPEGVDRDALTASMPAGKTAIFLCGNPEMVKTFAAQAEGSAYESGLVYEKYW